MNRIGGLVGIPPGGWTQGLSRLFHGADVRLVGLLAVLARPRQSAVIARNLQRAGRFAGVNAMLTLVTAAREHHSSITATSARLVNSFREGGLDFLWAERSRLGLPNSVIQEWQPVPAHRNPETGNLVHPARIPARDETMVYGAQINANFQRYFKRHLALASSNQAAAALAGASRVALLIWQAYSFLAPSGAAFDPKRTFLAQANQHFGCRSALEYLAQSGAADGRGILDLDEIRRRPELNRSEWVRIAKVRAAETLFLERLLKTTRELLPFN